MEENKINMPPPPQQLRKMPPPPPPKIEQKTEEVKEESVIDTTVQEEVNPFEIMSQDAEAETNQMPQDSKKKKEKEEKVKHQSAGGIKTALYWVGFAVSLVAVGVLIYLLVR